MKKTIVLLLSFGLILALSGCQRTIRSNSLEDYLNPNAPLIYSELLIFPPKEDLSEVTVKKYISETVRTLLFDDIVFLLQCNYSPEKYEQEISRFKVLGAQYREDLFQYPSYVMLFYTNCCEYALLDADDYSVVYVYAKTPDLGFSPTALIPDDFPEEYLPVARPEKDIVVYKYD